MPTIAVNTSKPQQIIDITEQIEKEISGLQAKDGICIVYVPHATAALIINEFEPNLETDFLKFFEKLIPENINWMHNKIDNNAAAHLKSALFGPSLSIPIHNSSLSLGTWQRVLLCEFDGPRNRRVTISIAH